MPQISINSLLANSGPSYPEAIAAPYRQELVDAGFEQLLTASDVQKALGRLDDQLVLLVLNSVCGCSARVARPGTILSLLNDRVPDQLVTVFAGMEKDAVAHLREKYLPGLTPSSPNIALFKRGRLIHLIHRHQIEGMSAQGIAADLAAQYDLVCSNRQSLDNKESIKRLVRKNFNIGQDQLSID
jgi:putative YphP/YqiW family bacilliredoxin